MKLNINVLGMELFSGSNNKILDLDTGRIWTLNVHKEVSQVKRYRILPSYTRAPIYQSYFILLNEHLGISDNGKHKIATYPKYDLMPLQRKEHLNDFLYHASHFAQEIEYLLVRDRLSEYPQYPISFPTFWEYLASFTRQFAKEWCEKEGYEWYEE